MNRIALLWVAFGALLLGIACNENEVYDPQLQLAKDLTAIDNYITENGIEARKDPSGIRFAIQTQGTEALPPDRTQIVEVKYTGRLLNGTVFAPTDTTKDYLVNYIAGWVQGIEILPVGTEATLFIPSTLGYGNQAVGTIPANSPLIFDVKLLSVSREESAQTQLEEDMAEIDTYLSDNTIDAETDPLSGVRYVVQEEGLGFMADWYDPVRVTYAARILGAESDFFSGTSEPDDDSASRVVDYIQGMMAALIKFPQGTQVTVYVPSPMAFGTASSTTIPANSILVISITDFEVVE